MLVHQVFTSFENVFLFYLCSRPFVFQLNLCHLVWQQCQTLGCCKRGGLHAGLGPVAAQVQATGQGDGSLLLPLLAEWGTWDQVLEHQLHASCAARLQLKKGRAWHRLVLSVQNPLMLAEEKIRLCFSSMLFAWPSPVGGIGFSSKLYLLAFFHFISVFLLLMEVANKLLSLFPVVFSEHGKKKK